MDPPTSLYRPPPLSAMYELAGLAINEGALEEDVVENRLPCETIEWEEEKETDAENHAKRICKDVVIRLERLKVSTSETTATTKSHPRKTQRLPKHTEPLLRRIFHRDLKSSYPSVSHISFYRVRQEMSKIRKVFPYVTDQQVRDKLFTITKQESRKGGSSQREKE